METHLIGFNHVGDAERLGYEHIPPTECQAPRTVDATREVFRTVGEKQRPFFVKVGFTEVHRHFTHGSDTAQGVFVPPWLQDTEDMRNDLAAFQATIKYFDERVGEILDALACSDVAENTLVIMTSDHGIPYPGAKWTVRKAGIEVPLILYQPGTVFTGGRIFPEVMSNVDVLPTLLDYLEADIPENMQGVSFKSIIEGASQVIE